MLDFIMNLLGYENIEKILIQKDFKMPKKEKIIIKAKFYLSTGNFQDKIIINQDKILLDGYSTYIVCKNQSRKYIKVLKIRMDPREYKMNYKLKKKTKRTGEEI